LLDIANEAKRRGLDINFIVAGRVNKNHQGYYDKILEKKKNLNLLNVNFTGECFKVKEFLLAANIYLCCSNNEASPTSVWEGMATGLPAITTDVGNVRQVIRNGIDGYVCNFNVEEIVDKIQLLYLDRELWNKMRNNSQLRIKELFGVEQNGKSLTSLYLSLVK